MRHQAQHRRRHGSARSARMRRLKLFEPEAEPVHAGVDLQPHHEAVRPRVRFQQRDLLERVNHELEIVLRCTLELTCAEHAFEQHDRDARCPRCAAPALLDARDTEASALGERARGVNETMAVGVGLDGGDHARAGAKRRTTARLLRSAAASSSHAETARGLSPRQIHSPHRLRA